MDPSRAADVSPIHNGLDLLKNRYVNSEYFSALNAHICAPSVGFVLETSILHF
jgi:hypothetical protein